MSPTPRLSIGLPIYNGENFLTESLEALLGQSYENYELIISDNASTDSTQDICRQYERGDSRIRYFRQERNLGLSPNHNFVFDQARGDLFKWASHDDLYARDMLERCVDALDQQPDVVLAHSWTAFIDSSGNMTRAIEYGLNTSSPSAPDRFRSLLFHFGGDDDGGVIRVEVLRRVAERNSYHHSDRTFVAEIGLFGSFYQVPDWLYFRRDHPARAERACPTVRTRCSNMDPRRANRLLHPKIRLYGEYVLAYIHAIRRAPLTSAERRECYRHLGAWMALRAIPGRPEPTEQRAAPIQPIISIDDVVAGRRRSLA